MSHGEDDDDPQLKSLRAVWLSMPDEDPPERGLDALMAAARTKATEMSAAPVAEDETPSWWQRFLAGLRRPPVLAFATVLVLVAGAVLVGNRHTKLDATAPSGGASPSSEDVPTQAPTERSYETAPPPATMPPPPAPHLDRKESQHSVGGTQHLAAPRDDEANGVEVREGDQADATKTNAANETTATKTKATTTSGAKAPKGESTADTGRDSCSAIRAKLQGLQPADARAYRSKIASDPALAKCVESPAEAATAAPAE
jgi:hypothetical protein